MNMKQATRENTGLFSLSSDTHKHSQGGLFPFQIEVWSSSALSCPWAHLVIWKLLVTQRSSTHGAGPGLGLALGGRLRMPGLRAAGGPGRKRAGPGRAGVKQQPLKMGPLRGVPVHLDKCHSKINSLCTFGNYNYHFGVIYLVYNMNMAICFIILKVHLKLL